MSEEFIKNSLNEFRSKSLVLYFTPKKEEYSEAAKEYEQIWQEDGKRIKEVMEKISGLTFPEEQIDVVVYDGVSFAGVRSKDRKMRLRYNYPIDRKKSALIHELGHRLITFNNINPENFTEHQILDLILFDIWVEVYGEEFAREQVEIEKKLKGLVDYEECWKWVLDISPEERQEMFFRFFNT